MDQARFCCFIVASKKNHAPVEVPERDSGVVGGNFIMFIYLATVSRLGNYS